jgi:alkanesulfonate monooxygenase SsuD/methylene tetrahydromethanopterin reductase-like flavin-dependent oxidoreductase (luciferase family)
MEWCLQCHREPERFLRPKDQIFNMGWKPPANQLAEGRLVLGLAAGAPMPATEAEFAAAGADFATRIGRLDEAVRLWGALWDPARDPAEPLDFRGKYWSFDGIEGLPMPQRPGGPPLWLAGGGERALRRAGLRYDGWLPYPPTPEEYARGLGSVRRAATDQGRDLTTFTPALYVTINLGDDERARAELEHYTLDYYGIPLEAMATLQAFHAGQAEGAIEWLRGFIEAGARHVVVRFGSFDPRQQLERAEPLLDAIRSRGPGEQR